MKVLCVLVNGFEEIEMVTPIDLLRRAGAEVVIASLDGEPATGRSGITVVADQALRAARVEDFDLLFLPGGPGVQAMRTDGRAARLAQEFQAAGKMVSAICAAPLVLKDAGLIGAGTRFTAHFSTQSELPGVLAAERVVEDGGLVTSRGAGTALDFGLALVGKFFGEEKAAEVAEAIMA